MAEVLHEVVFIKIKKRDLWISLLALLVTVVAVLVWLTRRNSERKKKIEEGREEDKKLVEESKEYAMRQHIQHIDKGIKYHKYCGICNGSW